jgi:outer membrane receptor for ferrienterochelin and colicin
MKLVLHIFMNGIKIATTVSRQIFVLTLLLMFIFIVSTALAEEQIDYGDDYLSLSLQELLNTKVITSTKTAQKTSEAPAIISVITAKEIRQMGANTLTEVLTIVPGVTPLTQIKSDRLMVVRGLSLKDGVLVLIDGVPVNDTFDGSFDFYQNTIENIDRIEVIRGPGSALYGGYAVSAVIHIFTKKAKLGENQFKLKFGVGSFNERHLFTSVSTDLSKYIDRLAIAGSFAYSNTDGDQLTIVQDAIFTPTTGIFLPPLSNPSLTPTIRQESVEKFNGSFSLSYKNFSVDFNHQQLISMPIFSHLGLVTEVDHTLKESTLDRLSMAYEQTIFSAIKLDAKAYWINNQLKLFGQSQPPQISGDEDQDGLNENFVSGVIENFRHQTQTIGVEVEFNYKINNNQDLLLGSVYEKNTLFDVLKVANVSLIGRGPAVVFPTQDMSREFMPQGVDRTMSAFYVQDLYQINKNTNVTAGIRYGNYSDFGTTVNPRLALVHRFNKKFYSKVLYGEAFKPPSFSQLFDATPTQSPFRTRGNSKLLPTEITTIELQLGYDISQRIKSNISIFKNNTLNEMFFDATSGIEQWRNTDKREFQGAEVELKGAWLGLDFAFINYSYQKSINNEQIISTNIHPAHRLNTGGSYQFSDSINANFTLSYFSSVERANNDDRAKVKSKVLLRATIIAKDMLMSGLDAELSISNLLNQTLRDETEQAIRLLDDIPLEGRDIRFSLIYNF